ncbi:MAG: hypothetical protein GY820_22805 [Gammaproteobacteria bacterium]|nr:hypothetical protein [Gammaproteobacteria bacterium]
MGGPERTENIIDNIAERILDETKLKSKEQLVKECTIFHLTLSLIDTMKLTPERVAEFLGCVKEDLKAICEEFEAIEKGDE